MQVANYTYLKFVGFSQVSSWSSYALLGKNLIYTQSFSFVRIGNFLKRNKEQILVQDEVLYKRPTIRINGQGISLRDEVSGNNIGTKNQFRIHKGQFLLSKIDARNGAFGVVPEELEAGIITGNFWTFDVDYKQINPHYLTLLTGTKKFQELCQTASVGTTNRNYLQEDLFLNFEIPLPALSEQKKIVKKYFDKIEEAKKLSKQVNDLESEVEKYLFERLGIEKIKTELKKDTGLQLINFSDIQEWGVDKLVSKSNKSSSMFLLISLDSFPKISVDLFRGKSPKYKEGTSSFILNQKCNRWNEINLSFVKSVDEDWLKSISSNFFTKEGDVLINSTGEGTIGRASFITKEFEGLLYDSHMLLLRLNPTLINAELFVEIFNSEYGQNQVNDIKSAQATKQTELGISNLSRIKFPLPESLKTQNEIVLKIKEMRKLKKNLLNKTGNLKQEAKQEFEKAIFN